MLHSTFQERSEGLGTRVDSVPIFSAGKSWSPRDWFSLVPVKQTKPMESRRVDGSQLHSPRCCCDSRHLLPAGPLQLCAIFLELEANIPKY